MTRMKVYLAGKIYRNCWRHEVLPELKDRIHAWSLHGQEYEDRYPQRPVFDAWPVIQCDMVDYVGPFFMDRAHGGGPPVHLPNSHGVRAGSKQDVELEGHHGTMHVGESLGPSRKEVIFLCLEAISRADLVFAWISQPDIYGTIVELGYAKAIGKIIAVAGPYHHHDMWFVEELADGGFYHYSAAEAFSVACKRLQPLYLAALARRDYPAYLRTDHWIKTRHEARERAGHRCQLCNSSEQLQVHHRTYERLGREEPADLIVLCNSCHATFHGKLPGHGLTQPGYLALPLANHKARQQPPLLEQR